MMDTNKEKELGKEIVNFLRLHSFLPKKQSQFSIELEKYMKLIQISKSYNFRSKVVMKSINSMIYHLEHLDLD